MTETLVKVYFREINVVMITLSINIRLKNGQNKLYILVCTCIYVLESFLFKYLSSLLCSPIIKLAICILHCMEVNKLHMLVLAMKTPIRIKSPGWNIS